MMGRRERFAPRLQAAVDVDGTLIQAGGVAPAVVEWIRERAGEGFQVIVWSARGEQVAREAVDRAGIGELVAYAIAKPGVILDDQGWGWVRFTRAIDPAELEREVGG